MFKVFIIALFFFSVQGVLQPAVAKAPEYNSSIGDTLTEDQKVHMLLTYIRSLEGATFIRDNTEYNTDKAAGHLESKWNKHGKKIKTAEGFVNKLASESSSGKPYQIRFADGKTVTTQEVLQRELHHIESGTH
jgi:hypothetical protein